MSLLEEIAFKLDIKFNMITRSLFKILHVLVITSIMSILVLYLK